MKNLYEVLSDFWHKNILVKAGDVIELAKSEVKYIGHIVALVEDEVVAVVDAVEKPFKPADKKVDDVKEDVKG